MKTKILICGILPPPFFGHSMMYKMLMESQFPEAFDVTFLNMKFWSYEKHKKVTVLKLFQLIQYFLQYIVLILTKRPKYILYAMSFDKMPLLKDFLFCWTGRVLGCQIILHDMGQYLKVLYNDSSGFYKKLIVGMLNMTTASIVLGEKTRGVYEGFLEPQRTVSVLGSVEDSREGSRTQSIAVGHDSEKIRILYFSFLSVSKGVWTALKSVPKVLARNPKVHFTFAGPFESPQLREEIEEFIKMQHLEENVSLIGYVGTANERTKYFRESDIFIFPTHRDVFGLVLLHALAEGVPVVASIEGVIPEIIMDQQNGLLFPKGDDDRLAEKILFLADAPDLRKTMGEANRKRYLEVFTPQKYGQRMIAAFETIKDLTPAPKPVSVMSVYLIIIAVCYVLWRTKIFFERMV